MEHIKTTTSQDKLHNQFTITLEDIIALDAISLSDDDWTWLYECENGKCNETSIWKWLEFTQQDIELASKKSEKKKKKVVNRKLYLSDVSLVTNSVSFSSSSVVNNESSILNVATKSEGAITRIVPVDSRTYTRPKKRLLNTIVTCGREPLGEGSSVVSDGESHDQMPVTPVSVTGDSPGGSLLTSDTPKSSTMYSTKFKLNTSIANSPYSAVTVNNISSSNYSNASINNNWNNANSFNTSMSSSLGIIDIDELTNSQLRFTNIMNTEKTEFPHRQNFQPLPPHQQLCPNEKRSLTPSIVSDKHLLPSSCEDSKSPRYKFDMSDSDNDTTLQNLTLTNVDEQISINSSGGCRSNVVSNNPNSLSEMLTKMKGDNFLYSRSDDSYKMKADKPKLLNTAPEELLSISFPKDYLVVETNTPPTPDLSGKLVNSVENYGSNRMVNCKTVNGDVVPDLVNGDCDIEDNESGKPVNTPPQLMVDFNEPVAFSTPENRTKERRVKSKYNTFNKRDLINKEFINNNNNNANTCSDSNSCNNGSPKVNSYDVCSQQYDRLSDTSSNNKSSMTVTLNTNNEWLSDSCNEDSCSTMTLCRRSIGERSSSSSIDNPSASLDDLSDDQSSVTKCLNMSIRPSTVYNSSSDLPNAMFNIASPNSKKSETFTQLNSGLSKTTTTSGSRIPGSLNTTFRKSTLNTTFCKSTEALNGGSGSSGGGSMGERLSIDSGPEDDCMSTASDSSYSSSSTHIRNVCELQCIARLQEESLRQHSPNRRKHAWGASDGLQDSVAELRRSLTKLSDDGSHSDQSDRYSPTTVNNNDKSAVMADTRANSTFNVSHSVGLNRFGGSSERIYSSNNLQNNTVGNSMVQSRLLKTSGLRPPSVFVKPTETAKRIVQSNPVVMPLQPNPKKGSNLRPPSVIPRPMSQLPTPTVRSRLPKYNSQGAGRH